MAEKILNDEKLSNKVYDIYGMPYVKENPRINPRGKDILRNKVTVGVVEQNYEEAKKLVHEEKTTDILDDYIYWGPSKPHDEEEWEDILSGGSHFQTERNVAFTDQGYYNGKVLHRTDAFSIPLELAL